MNFNCNEILVNCNVLSILRIQIIINCSTRSVTDTLAARFCILYGLETQIQPHGKMDNQNQNHDLFADIKLRAYKKFLIPKESYGGSYSKRSVIAQQC